MVLLLITIGHLDIIERAIKVFDEVIISVAKKWNRKSPMFSHDKKVVFLETSKTS